METPSTNCKHRRTFVDRAGTTFCHDCGSWWERTTGCAAHYATTAGNREARLVTTIRTLLGMDVFTANEKLCAQVLQLKEALREIRDRSHRQVIELQDAPNAPRIEFWANQIDELSAAALADVASELRKIRECLERREENT